MLHWMPHCQYSLLYFWIVPIVKVCLQLFTLLIVGSNSSKGVVNEMVRLKCGEALTKIVTRLGELLPFHGLNLIDSCESRSCFSFLSLCFLAYFLPRCTRHRSRAHPSEFTREYGLPVTSGGVFLASWDGRVDRLPSGNFDESEARCTGGER